MHLICLLGGKGRTLHIADVEPYIVCIGGRYQSHGIGLRAHCSRQASLHQPTATAKWRIAAAQKGAWWVCYAGQTNCDDHGRILHNFCLTRNLLGSSATNSKGSFATMEMDALTACPHANIHVSHVTQQNISQ